MAATPGIDYLGGAKYIDRAIAVHPKGWAAGFIYNVDGFGDAHAAIDKFCAQAQPSSVRVHLMWRDDHNFNDEKQWKTIVARAQRLVELSNKYPAIQFLVSPALEHRLPAAKIRKLVDQVRAVLPATMPIVNSYISGGSALPDVINECHGVKPGKPRGARGYLVSWDGTSMFNNDVESWKKRYADAWVLFAWDWRNNLKAGEKDKTPRPKRKATPSVEYLKSQVRLMQPMGSAPKTSFTSGKRFKKFGGKALLKSHAEDAPGYPSGRINRLLFILPERASSVDILDVNGKRVTTARYGGAYKGAHRYYASEYGYQVGEKARLQAGSEFVVVKVGSALYEPVNPAFRRGYF